MKKIFIVILNWNGGRMIVNCLDSLNDMKRDGLEVKVVVVDNGSTDGSVERIETAVTSGQWLVASEEKKKRPTTNHPARHASPAGQGLPARLPSEARRPGALSGWQGEAGRQPPATLRLIKNSSNLGFAEGNNVGIKYALKNGADYVCLLNNDTRVSSDFLTQLIKTADSDERIGIVGGKIYFEKGYEFHKEKYKESELGKVIWYAGGIIDWNNVYATHRGVDEVDRGEYDPPAGGEETEYVNGCLMLIKKEVFKKIGLLDPKYYAYFEENDFCQRAKKAGYKLYFAPKAIIWHLNAGSSGPGSSLHDYFLTRNRLLFGMKWAPLRSKMALVKESIWMLVKGRRWQKIAVRDFYLGRFEKGSWRD